MQNNTIEFHQIQPGDRVVLVTGNGRRQDATAIERHPLGWKCNGPLGIPVIATANNFVRARREED